MGKFQKLHPKTSGVPSADLSGNCSSIPSEIFKRLRWVIPLVVYFDFFSRVPLENHSGVPTVVPSVFLVRILHEVRVESSTRH